jgi:hypothetical protein
MSRTPTELRRAFEALRADLVHEDGPRISTMRNYRFAILPYLPSLEFDLRREAQRLSADLVANGWVVIPIDLQALLHARLRAQGEDWLARVSQMEARLAGRDAGRGLGYLESKLSPLIEGPDGLAADVCACIETRIQACAAAGLDVGDRAVALIGRAGALYPFFRSSALLRHIDGRTRGVPVVLLYPGERRAPVAPGAPAGLSFMGVLEPDHDYRPRIYA